MHFKSSGRRSTCATRYFTGRTPKVQSSHYFHRTAIAGIIYRRDSRLNSFEEERGRCSSGEFEGGHFLLGAQTIVLHREPQTGRLVARHCAGEIPIKRSKSFARSGLLEQLRRLDMFTDLVRDRVQRCPFYVRSGGRCVVQLPTHKLIL